MQIYLLKHRHRRLTAALKRETNPNKCAELKRKLETLNKIITGDHRANSDNEFDLGNPNHDKINYNG
jgi:hypothetical protein